MTDTAKSTVPRAPAGLSARGRRLWRAVVNAYELTVAEVELLTEAARCADRCEAYENLVARTLPLTRGSRGQMVANPLYAQLRSERLLLAKLLAQLAFPDPDGKNEWDGLTASARARKAARVRWDGKRP